jgi:membrane protein implicated in regulation of membrane protease activity
MYFGAFLMMMELLVPGFVVFFFGLSAMSVGIGRFVLGESFSMTWQFVAFSALSICYLIVLRRWLKSVFSGYINESRTDMESGLVGRTGKIVEDVAPPLAGRVEIGDSQWSAVSDRKIAAGVNVKVTAQNNLTLTVVEV